MEQSFPLPIKSTTKTPGNTAFLLLGLFFGALLLGAPLLPGWRNIYQHISYGSELDWQGQKIQLPLNWSIAPSASAQLRGTATLESYRWISLPFASGNDPVSSNLTLFPPPARYSLATALTAQGDLAQRNRYTGFIPTAVTGQYSCIARTLPPTEAPANPLVRTLLYRPTRLFDLQCFREDRGWSFSYYGSPSQVDQVFAMLAYFGANRATP